jgi:hypothetical protein
VVRAESALPGRLGDGRDVFACSGVFRRIERKQTRARSASGGGRLLRECGRAPQDGRSKRDNPVHAGARATRGHSAVPKGPLRRPGPSDPKANRSDPTCVRGCEQMISIQSPWPSNNRRATSPQASQGQYAPAAPRTRRRRRPGRSIP